MTNRIRKHLSFSNVIAALALFIALGGSAYAVGKNTIGTSQIKNNAVTAKKIKKNAVVTAKIKNKAVTASKIKDGSVTGAKIPASSIDGSKLQLDTLGTVPSAASAAEAAALAGQNTVLIKLAGGQTAEVAKHGQVSITATCKVNEGGDDIIELFAGTTVNGAVFEGDDSKSGGPAPADFLNTDTPDVDRGFAVISNNTGVPYVSTDIDEGFVLGPDGKGILANTEGLILGVNYLDSACIVGGVFNQIG
ncbi:MAG TPA: hypothetical protein VMF31_11765 [Solirubrobacterales bacterium]|nr:hypothetical protein [Solirubrobacterales bacterium]